MTKVFAVLFLLMTVALPASATQPFAKDTGKACAFCHIGDPEQLNFTEEGEAFVENSYKLPEDGSKTLEHLKKKLERLLISLHALSAFALVGMAFFIRFTADDYIIKRDISSQEKTFTKYSSAILALTGLYLVWALPSGEGFWTSIYGYSLIAKVVVASLLICNSLYIVSFQAKKVARLRKEGSQEALLAGCNSFRGSLRFSFILGVLAVIITALSSPV